jgi:hypothetical protein
MSTVRSEINRSAITAWGRSTKQAIAVGLPRRGNRVLPVPEKSSVRVLSFVAGRGEGSGGSGSGGSGTALEERV